MGITAWATRAPFAWNDGYSFLAMWLLFTEVDADRYTVRAVWPCTTRDYTVRRSTWGTEYEYSLESQLDCIVTYTIAKWCDDVLHTGDKTGAALRGPGHPTAFAAVAGQNRFRGILGKRIISGADTGHHTSVRMLDGREQQIISSDSCLEAFYQVRGTCWDRLARRIVASAEAEEDFELSDILYGDSDVDEDYVVDSGLLSYEHPSPRVFCHALCRRVITPQPPQRAAISRCESRPHDITSRRMAPRTAIHVGY